MKTVTSHLMRAIVLTLCLLPAAAGAQVSIRALNLSGSSCAGRDMTVTFGLSRGHTVEVGRQEATLGHSERIFLPDGVMCDGSCSYRSPVTFTAFADTATIRSVENIKYVRLNLEHSFIGDIYINITCPNGQEADLMRFAGSGSSACDNAIPSRSRRWLNGNNMGEDTYFGMAFDRENTQEPCNPYAQGNQPGTGWNYCWSSNTTSGYHYASGDGIIYRAGHSHQGRVDSSNVAAHTNFYHPDDNFSRLVGCPLNGTWYIEVVDGYSVDNGYIFEWELALDASLIPDQCYPEKYLVEGGANEQIDDSTFRLLAPADVAADSTISYRFLVVTSCGDTLDTTASVTYHPNRESSRADTICEGRSLRVGNQTVSEAGRTDVMLSTPYGCDSLVHVDLTLYPHYDEQFEDSTCLNVPYPFDGHSYRQPGVYRHPYTTVHGCDSVRTLTLHVAAMNLKARIQAYPLALSGDERDIRLKDISLNHIASRWMIGDMESTEPSLTIAYPVEQDSLPISLEVASREGCYDTATVTARYDRSRIFMPNAFTPNEATNNRWQPVVQDVTEMEVWIYDRHGRLVAHWEGVDEAWDGGECPTGAYVYTLRYRTRVYPEWEQRRSGTVLLLR